MHAPHCPKPSPCCPVLDSLLPCASGPVCLQTLSAKAAQVAQVLSCLQATESELATERAMGMQLQQTLEEQQVAEMHEII